jgi:hypothetical protein
MNSLHISFHPVAEEAPYSVLAAHYKTNRQPRAPDHQDLQQAPVRDARGRYPNDTEDEDNAEDQIKRELWKDNTTPPEKRTPRHSHPSTAKQTQLGYYKHDSGWVDILESAKNLYRLHVHTREAFPPRTRKNLQHAGRCIMERIAAYEADNANTEPLNQSKNPTTT